MTRVKRLDALDDIPSKNCSQNLLHCFIIYCQMIITYFKKNSSINFKKWWAALLTLDSSKYDIMQYVTWKEADSVHGQLLLWYFIIYAYKSVKVTQP